MPKRLPDRCRPDCIAEFLGASGQRFQEGLSLEAAGYRTAAIYLWGYTAEMLLKAAYFRVIGFVKDETITGADLNGAKAEAPKLGFTWIGNLHNLGSWAQLLVATRVATLKTAYPTPGFGKTIVDNSQLLQELWKETLRYHKNVAYPFEVRQVRDLAEWLLLHASYL